MKKVLILGTDIHAEQYINVLLFKENFELFQVDNNFENNDSCVISNKKKIIDLNEFYIIIYSTPLRFSNRDFEYLKEYKGILIIEKTQQNFKYIDNLSCKIYIFHLRNFISEDNIELGKYNIIKWPNLNNEGMNPLWNVLPNVLDLIKNLDIDISNIKIIKCIKSGNSIIIDFKASEKNFNIKIYNTNNVNSYVNINKKEIEWPNYFIGIEKIFMEIENNNINYEMSIFQEKKYVEFIKEMEIKYEFI